MVAGIFHQGSGLGDQLMRYITVRTLAEEKGYKWGMVDEFNFKGYPFLYNTDLWSHKKVEFSGNVWNELIIKNEQGFDIRSYDPEINFIEDNTLIEGSFEDSKYWGHNLDHINTWLQVEPLQVLDDTCVIGFRGGEYATVPDLFLPKEYYLEAMSHIQKLNPKINFEVHTDDSVLARQFFPDHFGNSAGYGRISVIENQPISHSKHTNMGFNWRAMRYAKYAIIPNSAFYILPRLLKHHEDPTAVTIAPRYWARYNRLIWARPSCYYSKFTYIHHGAT